jgi:uncharacterized membrane protein YgaE (UPF0421/DUF939 family)
VILFALLRAVALPISVAIAFGLQVPNANWMPIATIVAMKPSSQQSALVAKQRVAGTIRAMNYALYVAASAAVVLIAADLPNPSNLTAEGRRILFTFIGVGIAIIVMFLASLLQKRAAKAAPQSPEASTA